ncbi:hypothetical protein LCGC14_2307570, partial [marine sediment metagenome]
MTRFIYIFLAVLLFCGAAQGKGKIDDVEEKVDLLGTDDDHITKFTGDIWYCDTTGSNSDDGKSPNLAFLTPTYAITQAAAGDKIILKAGTYTDNNLNMNLDGLELWGEIGAEITPASTTTCLVVSGSDCLVNGVK